MAKSFDELADRTMPPASRARAARRTRAILAQMLLAEVRKLAGQSQSELAKNLGIKQPTLSKLESQKDMQISTLQRIVKALGGEVEIIARFPKTAVELGQFKGRAMHSAGKKARKPTARRVTHARRMQIA